MGSRTHAEMNIWLWKVKIAEEGAGHKLVVMLTSMNEDVSDRSGRSVGRICQNPLIMLVDRRDDRRGLHEIGTRAHNSKNLHYVILRPSHPAISPYHWDLALSASTTDDVTPRSRQSGSQLSLKRQRVCSVRLPAAPSPPVRSWYANL